MYNIVGWVEDIEVEGIDVEDIEVEGIDVQDIRVEDIEVEDIHMEDIEVENIHMEDIEVEDIHMEDIEVEGIDVQDIGRYWCGLRKRNIGWSTWRWDWPAGGFGQIDYGNCLDGHPTLCQPLPSSTSFPMDPMYSRAMWEERTRQSPTVNMVAEHRRLNIVATSCLIWMVSTSSHRLNIMPTIVSRWWLPTGI